MRDPFTFLFDTITGPIREKKLSSLREQLATVEMEIANRTTNSLLTMPADLQKTYILTAKRSLSGAQVAMNNERVAAAIRMGIRNADGSHTEKFKKSIEASIGATEEEMAAGYKYDSRFSAILYTMEAKLVDENPQVVLLTRAVR